ncbi:glycosyltransferase, partial [Patescibacteria group bacterium]
MELSIAINNYKNPELLRLCIESIKRNVQGIEYELIVADSATEEATSLMMREDFPEVKFFPFSKNVGFQRLLHQGIEASTGKYLLLLNGDILATKNSVEQMIAHLKQHPEVGMLGPKLLNFNETLQYSCFRYYKPITILYRRTFLGRLPFAQKHLDWFLMKDYDHQKPKEVD